MSGKTSRQVRKCINKLKAEEGAMADKLIFELLNAPFSYRFKFAMQLLFWRKKK